MRVGKFIKFNFFFAILFVNLGDVAMISTAKTFNKLLAIFINLSRAAIIIALCSVLRIYIYPKSNYLTSPVRAYLEIFNSLRRSEIYHLR